MVRPCSGLRTTGKPRGASSHDEPDDKIRNLEEGKDLRGYLDQKPRDNSVSNGDAIYVAPLEFGKKAVRVHDFPLGSASLCRPIHDQR